MRNKIVFVLILTLTSTMASSAQAEQPKSLVIIDTAISADQTWAQSILIEEACFIEYGKCPNGQNFMEGKGSASIQGSAVKDVAMHHGTQMASIAYQINPSTKLIMVRIAGLSAKGYTNTYTTKAVVKALNWVKDNSTRLNVGAISLSIGRSYSQPQCPIENELRSIIQSLDASNIPVIASSGNGYNRTKIDYPACISEVVAIGATDTRYTLRNIPGWIYPIMNLSNSSSDLDFYTLGRYMTTDLNGNRSLKLGTSAATAAFASYLVREQNKGLTTTQVLTQIRTSLSNAYRSGTEFYPLHFEITR